MKRLFWCAVLTLGCWSTAEAAGPVRAATLERWLEATAGRVEKIEAGWKATVDGIEVLVFAHPAHDRMRAITPVVPVAELPAGAFEVKVVP